jgi:hypothetical protein
MIHSRKLSVPRLVAFRRVPTPSKGDYQRLETNDIENQESSLKKKKTGPGKFINQVL